MNICDINDIKALLARHGFRFSKSMGQNFLIDKNVLDSILDAAMQPTVDYQQPTVDCKTLEIGPGLGVLTEGLLGRGCAVTAVEKDPVLADRLKVSLGNPDRLTVLKGDALDYIKDGACDGFPLMVSNLPYQAGTRILIEMIDRIGRFEVPEVIVVLVQTEVAERLAAKEGSKVRGLAGVRVQFDYDVQIVRKVAASCFWPRPEIGSSVVKLVRHHRNDDVGEVVRKTFKWLTKRAFEHRPEQLTNEDWLALAAAIEVPR